MWQKDGIHEKIIGHNPKLDIFLLSGKNNSDKNKLTAVFPYFYPILSLFFLITDNNELLVTSQLFYAEETDNAEVNPMRWRPWAYLTG